MATTTLTKLEKTAERLRTIIEDEGGLELDLSKARVKSVLRIAQQLDDIVAGQRLDIVAEAEASKAREDAVKAEAVAEVVQLIDKYGLSISDIRKTKKVESKPHPSTESAVIRQWAMENGIEVSPLGIIPKRVRAAYAEAARNE